MKSTLALPLNFLFTLFERPVPEPVVVDPSTIKYEPHVAPVKKQKDYGKIEYAPVNSLQTDESRRDILNMKFAYEPIAIAESPKAIYVPMKLMSTALPPLVDGKRPDYNTTMSHIREEREKLNPLPKLNAKA